MSLSNHHFLVVVCHFKHLSRYIQERKCYFGIDYFNCQHIMPFGHSSSKRKVPAEEGPIVRRRRLLGLSKLRPLYTRPRAIPKSPLLDVDIFFVGLVLCFESSRAFCGLIPCGNRLHRLLQRFGLSFQSC